MALNQPSLIFIKACFVKALVQPWQAKLIMFYLHDNSVHQMFSGC